MATTATTTLASLGGCGSTVSRDSVPTAHASSSGAPTHLPEVFVEAPGQERLDWLMPVSWKNQVRMEAIADATSSVSAIERELGRYPPGTVRRYISQVVVTKSIAIDLVEVAGTGSNDVVFVVAADQLPGNAEHALAHALHHEIAALVYRNEAQVFPAKQWSHANPDDFRYVGTGLAAAKLGMASTAWSLPLARNGFVNLYAASSLMNDFSELHSFLMCATGADAMAIKREPPIERKIGLAREFWVNCGSPLVYPD